MAISDFEHLLQKSLANQKTPEPDIGEPFNLFHKNSNNKIGCGLYAGEIKKRADNTKARAFFLMGGNTPRIVYHDECNTNPLSEETQKVWKFPLLSYCSYGECTPYRVAGVLTLMKGQNTFPTGTFFAVSRMQGMLLDNRVHLGLVLGLQSPEELWVLATEEFFPHWSR